MKVFIDNEYKCHTEPGNGRKMVDVVGFDGKCKTFIEGYRFIPSGESWMRSDGIVFHGEMITPWKPLSELDNAQREYEKQLLAEYESALAEIEAALGV